MTGVGCAFGTLLAASRDPRKFCSGDEAAQRRAAPIRT